MATLDFSDVIHSPEFMSGFSVLRRTEVVDSSGRSTVTTQTITGLVGIVTFASGGTRRDPEAQSASRTLSVITKFLLREASEGVQPDIVVFNGTHYTVTKVDPWHQLGSGFVSAQASIQQASVPTTL